MFSIFKLFFLSKNSFEGKLPGEETVFITRRHWFVLFPPFLVTLFLAIFPFLIYLFLHQFIWYSIISSLFWFLIILYFLILWILLFYNLMIYFLTYLIVTNKRLIRIETKGFFKYERDETELKRVQDISLRISGFFAAFLDFGDLEIQTAGSKVKFNFSQLPHPQKIKEIIIGLTK